MDACEWSGGARAGSLRPERHKRKPRATSGVAGKCSSQRSRGPGAPGPVVRRKARVGHRDQGRGTARPAAARKPRWRQQRERQSRRPPEQRGSSRGPPDSRQLCRNGTGGAADGIADPD
ncbi:hypothetical protein NDU88_003696 [Pleurodeles waltl]|uniref:Uncharacterized protein n=1 Tax=Pleurodeles waltl TaxID=8319 RepID=A0AAV7T5X1_PLEWA|nr:hypothetical protein NDU88_003696 [Pleurodeles waltl]